MTEIKGIRAIDPKASYEAMYPNKPLIGKSYDDVLRTKAKVEGILLRNPNILGVGQTMETDGVSKFYTIRIYTSYSPEETQVLRQSINGIPTSYIHTKGWRTYKNE